MSLKSHRSSQFNIPPFYDDYSLEKGYLRALFRPGYAVQARELTQIQTMLQAQVEQFGSHVFQDGSIVAGGQSSEKTVDYVRVRESYQWTVGSTAFTYTFDPQDWVGFELTQSSQIQLTLSTPYTPGLDFIVGQVVYQGSAPAGPYPGAQSALGEVVSWSPAPSGQPGSILVLKDVAGTFVTDGSETVFPAGGPPAFGYVASSSTASAATRAKVIHAVPPSSNDDPYVVLFFEYLTGGATFQESQEIQSSITTKNARTLVKSSVDPLDNPTIPVFGRGKVVSLDAGAFFVDGFFVAAGSQKVAPYRLSAAAELDPNSPPNIRLFSDENPSIPGPTSRVGLSISRDIVTASEDTTLNDPAYGSYNYNAPGADRYRISLTLDHIPLSIDANEDPDNFSSPDFIELIRFVGGEVTKKVKYPIYSELEDTLARRTYDESGSYTVRAFGIDVREHLRDTTQPQFVEGVYTSSQGGSEDKLAIGIGPGKAYIFGYEYENQSTKFLSIDKARSPEHVQLVAGFNVDVNPGFYVLCDAPDDADIDWNGYDLTNQELVELYDGSADLLGTARIRQMIPNIGGSEFRAYLTAVQILPGKSFGNLRAIHDPATPPPGAPLLKIAVTGIDAGITQVYDRTANSLVFPLPVVTATKEIKALNYRVQKTFDITFGDGVNSNVISTGSPYLRFTGGYNLSGIVGSEKNQHYILVRDSGERVDLTSGVVTTNNNNLMANGNVSITLGSPISMGETCKLIVTLDVNDDTGGSISIFRTKTYVEDFSETVPYTSGTVILSNVDGYGFSQVLDSDNTDITDRFLFDTGQRPNVYRKSSLILKTGATPPIGPNVTVTYSYFARSGIGPFLVNSYIQNPSNFVYDNIPAYTDPQTGTMVSLRDVIDFRPDEGTTETDPWINWAIPLSGGEQFQVDYEQYLGRIDKVVLNKDRRFGILRGVPAVRPQPPQDDEGAMTLYVLRIQPYTFDTRDVLPRYVENKRYTMRDIGRLEKRIDRIEYYTALSLLEKEADSLTITDDSGNTLFKNGILVDSFKGHQVGDVANPDYWCSMDFEQGELRPAFYSRLFGFELISNPTPNLVTSPDGIVTLAYTTTEAISQPLASIAISVNPFNVVSWLGTLVLTPDSDIWYDTERRPTVTINLEGENDAWAALGAGPGFGTQWNDWQTNWSGVQTTNWEQSFDRQVERRTTVDRSRPHSTGQVRNTITETVVTRETFLQQDSQTRTGITTTLVPETITRELGDRIVNVSIIPFIRANSIRAQGAGLKPNTRLYAFFDTESVVNDCRLVAAEVSRSGSYVNANTLNIIPPNNGASYLTVGGLVTLRWIRSNVSYVRDMVISAINLSTQVVTLVGTNTSPPDTAIPNDLLPFVPVFHGVLWSDQRGEVRVEFDIPASKFRTGSRLFRLTDEASNNSINATTAAEAMYTAQGLVQTREDTVVSTKVPTLRRESVQEDRVVSTVFTRETSTRETFDSAWYDPLAQTILVDASKYPNGMFVDSVDLFFRRKDANLPVTLQIRPTVNGYPHSASVLPLASVTLRPEQVQTSESPDATNANTYTRFKFSSPIYLQPGEYALVVMSNSDLYEVWIAQIGENQVGTQNRISQQPYAGVMFKSQNASTWSADQTADLMFRMNRCKFVTGVVGTYEFRNTYEGDPSTTESQPYDLMELMSTEFFFPNTELRWSVATTPNQPSAVVGNYTEILSNSNVRFGSPRKVMLNPIPQVPTLKSRLQMTTSDDSVSPIVDVQRIGAIVVQNFVNSETDTDPNNPTYNGELEPRAYTSGPNGPGAWARYITRRVNLESGFESDNLRVLLTASRPVGTEIQVFIRAKRTDDDSNFDDLPWIQLDPSPVVVSGNEDDFREMTYTTPPGWLPADETYSVFAVKICLYSDNTTIVPRVRDMRAIALS